MNKVAVICIFVLTITLSLVTSGCAEAIFEVSNLSVSPQEVESGQSATVSVEITNTGGAEGSYLVLLKIDGAQVEEKNITVSPDTTEQVTFFVTREKVGSYAVDVNGLTATLKVLKPAEFKTASLIVTIGQTSACLSSHTYKYLIPFAFSIK